MTLRGRPRQYDRETALLAAQGVFWEKGYSDTSMDDLGEAMSMNRPSIYRAFGDKKAVYLAALQHFIDGMETAFQETMGSDAPIAGRLEAFFSAALGIYTGGVSPKGCLVMTTAITLAPGHPEIQTTLQQVLDTIDSQLTLQFREAASRGEVSDHFSAEARARLAQALLHSLSIRARAGGNADELSALMRDAVGVIMA